MSVLLSPLAYAAGERCDGQPPSWKEMLSNFLPVAIILVMLYLFLRAQTKSPRAKRAQEYLERGTQHMQRMEEMMEKLIKAVEANKKE